MDERRIDLSPDWALPVPNDRGITFWKEKFISFSLSTESLKMNSLNSLEFGSNAPGNSFVPVLMFPDPVFPYFPPYQPLAKIPDTWRLYPDHICEVLDGGWSFGCSTNDPYLVDYESNRLTPESVEQKDGGYRFSIVPAKTDYLVSVPED
jgi:hypothetical protein